LAGVGSFALEFRYLSDAFGFPVYRQTADAVFRHVSKHRRRDGIVPEFWNVMTGMPTDPSRRGGLGSGSDSFYEYLLKVPLLAGGCATANGEDRPSCRKKEEEEDGTLEDMLALYKTVVASALPSNHVHRTTPNANLQGGIAYPVDHGRFHHLLCFLPGLLALGAANFKQGGEEDDADNDMVLAEELIRGCHDMYEQSPTGLGPEEVPIDHIPHRKSQTGGTKSYLLRPEYIESVFVLYRLTGDTKYQQMGWKFYQSLERYCRTDGGYTGLLDVYDTNQNDQPRGEKQHRIDDMPSYFIAETLKYLLLLFGPDDYVSLDNFVFTTEAHPMRKITGNRRFVIPDSDDYGVTVPFPCRLGVLACLLLGMGIWILWLGVRVATRMNCSLFRLWRMQFKEDKVL